MDCNVGRHQEEGRKAGQVMARLFSRGFEEGAAKFWRAVFLALDDSLDHNITAKIPKSKHTLCCSLLSRLITLDLRY